MKINFSTVLISAEGKPIKEDADKDCTLGFVAINALLGTMKGDEEMSGEDKLKYFQLAQKIADGRDKNKEIDMAVEDVSKIKARIGKMYGAAIVGPAWTLLK